MNSPVAHGLQTRTQEYLANLVVAKNLMTNSVVYIISGGAVMDKVITINDYWDGPKLGLATFDGTPCIYERVFSEDLDDYTDFYDLTPIDKEIVDIVMNDWSNWLQWMKNDCSPERAKTWKSDFSVPLNSLAQKSKAYHKYQRRADFQGTYHNCYTETTNLNVIWFL